MQKTPLYEKHVQAGGKVVEFGGFLLPVQYSGIIAEHTAVRTCAGMFDVSHMGELIMTGSDALNNLQNLLTNDMSGMADGQARYSPMCNENGGVVDDLIVYKFADNEYFLVVNASNTEKDFEWMKKHLFGDVKLENKSALYGQIALQGPKAEKIIAKIADAKNIPQKNYTFIKESNVAGIQCILSRTGYTGEDGFEIYCAAENTPKMWDELLSAGKEFGLIPCGLGARDTLRMEAAMPLYGHEMNDEISPLEGGVGIFVKLDKADFIGKAAVEKIGKTRFKRIGLKIVGKGIAREGLKVYKDGKEIGVVTSGTHSPTLGYPVAMARVNADSASKGDKVEVDVRGRMVEAEVIPLPFYKRA